MEVDVVVDSLLSCLCLSFCLVSSSPLPWLSHPIIPLLYPLPLLVYTSIHSTLHTYTPTLSLSYQSMHYYSLLLPSTNILIRRISPSPPSISPSRPPSSPSISTPPRSSSSTPTRHPRQIRPFGHHLEVPAAEHTLVEHQGLRDETGLCEFHVCVAS